KTLQSIPVAVSVTSGETLARAQIRDIRDLSALVPSLRVSEHQSSSQTDFNIRGFGNGANNVGIEPSVGVFIDGVYRSRSAASIADFPDVKRIEVLRGPQSTLFGKNASAGVISVVTAEPKFVKMYSSTALSYGNYNGFAMKSLVGGKISDTLAGSFSSTVNLRAGTVLDGKTGDKINNRRRTLLRGQLLFVPNDSLKMRLIADYGSITERCCAVVNLKASAATGVVNALGGQVNPANAPFGNLVYNNFNSTNAIKNYGLSGQIDYSMGPLTLTSITSWRKSKNITNQDSDFSSADLLGQNYANVRITTFTQEFRAATNLDGPINFLAGAYYFNEKIKQDGQILFGTQMRPYANALVQGGTGGALNLVTLENTFGALEGAPTKYQGKFFTNGAGLFESYRLKNEAYSLFGQFDFKFADKFTFTGGVNYTHDSKNFSTANTSTDVWSAVNFNAAAYAPFRNQLLYQGALAAQIGSALGLGGNATAAQIGAFAGANPAAFAAINAGSLAFASANMNNPAANPLNALKPLQFLPPFLNVPNAVEPGKTSDSNVAWTARLAYKASKQLNFYVSYATGYKASSINLSRDSRPALADSAAIVAGGLAGTNQSYGSRFAAPEKSTVYEVGVKANWGIASVNVAVFKQNIKDFQANLFTGTGFFLSNAGKQSVFGIEFEGSVHPTDELTINAAVTYLKPKYDSYIFSPFGDQSGGTPSGIPPISSTLGFNWNHALANDDHFVVRADWHYESPVQIIEGLPGFITKNSTTGAVISYQTGLDAARPYRREVSEIDASISYIHGAYEVSVWGRNLTNNRYITAIFDSPLQNGSVSGYPNQPRTYGVSAMMKF
ncbi:MAG: hypothetical protein RLY97_909, partial [Pseudomonadota bacterium]